MDLPLPLIIVCVVIVLASIIFPLIISYKSKKQEGSDEWSKIKEYGNKINDKTRKNK